MKAVYEYKLVKAGDYATDDEFVESLNRYGEEGYHIVAVRDVFSAIMEKEILVEEE